MTRLVLMRAGLAGYLFLLAWHSLQSYPQGMKAGLSEQIVHNSLHIPAYSVLTFLLLSSFNTVTRISLVYAAVFATGYGIMLEFLQGLTPDRTPSLMDIGLNSLGVIMVLFIYRKSVLAGPVNI